jgi:hypothetical protein
MRPFVSRHPQLLAYKLNNSLCCTFGTSTTAPAAAAAAQHQQQTAVQLHEGLACLAAVVACTCIHSHIASLHCLVTCCRAAEAEEMEVDDFQPIERLQELGIAAGRFTMHVNNVREGLAQFAVACRGFACLAKQPECACSSLLAGLLAWPDACVARAPQQDKTAHPHTGRASCITAV